MCTRQFGLLRTGYLSILQRPAYSMTVKYHMNFSQTKLLYPKSVLYSSSIYCSIQTMYCTYSRMHSARSEQGFQNWAFAGRRFPGGYHRPLSEGLLFLHNCFYCSECDLLRFPAQQIWYNYGFMAGILHNKYVLIMDSWQQETLYQVLYAGWPLRIAEKLQYAASLFYNA